MKNLSSQQSREKSDGFARIVQTLGIDIRSLSRESDWNVPSNKLRGPSPQLSQVAFLGNYLPRRCGIATFTNDLYRSVQSASPETRSSIICVTDPNNSYDYAQEVEFEIEEDDVASYRQAADFLNSQSVDVVCLQHEYGVYGGPAGSYILEFLKEVEAPVVTTMHTVLQDPTPLIREVTENLVRLSSRLVVMTRHTEELLVNVYGVERYKIDCIPHGIPDIPPDLSPRLRPRLLDGKQVVLTFGLLSPGKGIEFVLQALPNIVKRFPDVLYLVVGATHPNLLKEHGETYRNRLKETTRELSLEQHVEFVDRFVTLEELKVFIAAADLYVTPYLNEAQAVSGTLAYAYGCGKPVVSTPYWHAKELLSEEEGLLVPFRDSAAICKSLTDLLADPERTEAIGQRAYEKGRAMIWPNAAKAYLASFKLAAQERINFRQEELSSHYPKGVPRKLPRINLEHLIRMTDSTGMLQHAVYSVPRFSDGYCTDDNARALLLVSALGRLGMLSNTLGRLSSTYLAFLKHAFNRERGRFRNFMSFERKWQESTGSTDSHGRALWALGYSLSRSQSRTEMTLMTDLFSEAFPAVGGFTPLRSISFSLLGIVEYLDRYRGVRKVLKMRERLSEKLVANYHSSSSPDWNWFEDFLSYDNPRIAQALIVSGHQSGRQDHLEIGLACLEWLLKEQAPESSHLKPIGSDSVYYRGDSPSKFDQQPLEAWAILSASLAAFRATSNKSWYHRAIRALEWFQGHNDLGLCIYDPKTGASFDGLHSDSVNLNQGAESTLAGLLSLSEISLVQRSCVLTAPTNGKMVESI